MNNSKAYAGTGVAFVVGAIIGIATSLFFAYRNNRDRQRYTDRQREAEEEARERQQRERQEEARERERRERQEEETRERERRERQDEERRREERRQIELDRINEEFDKLLGGDLNSCNKEEIEKNVNCETESNQLKCQLREELLKQKEIALKNKIKEKQDQKQEKEEDKQDKENKESQTLQQQKTELIEIKEEFDKLPKGQLESGGQDAQKYDTDYTTERQNASIQKDLSSEDEQKYKQEKGRKKKEERRKQKENNQAKVLYQNKTDFHKIIDEEFDKLFERDSEFSSEDDKECDISYNNAEIQ